MIYRLKPNRVYRSYYGGRRLDELCGKSVCVDSRFPEEWIASTVRAFNPGREDIIEGPSALEDGRLLTDVISADPVAFFGKEQFEKRGKEMPFLVKLLDSAERLFIQCHPTVPFAKKYFNSDFGKTECWYVISAEDNAYVYIGFKPEITKEKWQTCFNDQDIAGMLDLMHKISVKPGDLIFVDGGMPHAIGEGCLLCELQEPTDYMVIPERTSKSGITLTDRKMHGGLGFERMIDCFEYNGYTESELKNKYFRHPVLKDNKLTAIVDEDLTDKFKMDCLKLNGETALDFKNMYCVGTLISGECTVRAGSENFSISAGKSFVVTAGSGSVEFSGSAVIMICRP